MMAAQTIQEQQHFIVNYFNFHNYRNHLQLKTRSCHILKGLGLEI